MSDTDSGQETPTRVSTSEDILAQLEELRESNQRLRGTQAANDRKIVALAKERDSLQTKIADMEAQYKATLDELESTRRSLQDIETLRQDAESLRGQLQLLTQKQSRIKKAASHAAQNPVLATLLATDALPQAETDEEFDQKLQQIAQNLSGHVKARAQDLLSGSIPAPTKAGDADSVEALEAKASALINQKRFEEAMELLDRAMSLRTSGG